ncbi:MAG TPA: Ig-like domain-containing protein [Kofleriaceae bacterium]|nr:Ig-like domain-containing protein [Kofleriaceae bacterium]
MRNTSLVSGLLLAATATAAAEPTLHAPGTARPFDFVASQTTTTRPLSVRRLLPANGTTNAVAQSRVIYLNHKGVTLRPGDDDARANTSSIVGGLVSVPAWNTSAATWNATVACFADMFKDFDVVVTDQDPGNVPHIEAVFGGYPGDIGMPSGVGGVSPFTEDCGIIENSIVFTFTEVFPDDAQTVCEVMAQEVAHSYGLDHELLASDPMTYLSYNGNRSFKDQLVSCGEYNARACGIGGSVCRNKQNSVALLKERLGVADAVAPTLAITSPADQAIVAPGFEVTATATDNVGVTMAALFVDGQPAAMTPGAGPFTFATDAALAEGSHEIRVDASDGRNTQSQTITVTVQLGGGSGSGSGSGSGDGGSGDGEDGSAGGGCSTAGGSGLALGLAVLALARRRRC